MSIPRDTGHSRAFVTLNMSNRTGKDSVDLVIKLSLGGISSYLARRAYLRFIYPIFPRRRFVNKFILGEALSIDRRDLEQVYLEADCVREPENIFIYRALAKSGLCKAYIDIGANFGHVASKVYEYFEQVVLVDANPKAAEFLRKAFARKSNVKVVNCALVESEEVDKVILMVSTSSSGLAHVADSLGAIRRSDEQAYECTASTLKNLIYSEQIRSAYVKIDVEGLESSVIRGGASSLMDENFIVGFEALSEESAIACCALFVDHTFYFGRLDFLDQSGALTRSAVGIIGAMFGLGGIAIYKTKHIAEVPLSNFSQIVAVPDSRVADFESALQSEYNRCSGKIELH